MPRMGRPKVFLLLDEIWHMYGMDPMKNSYRRNLWLLHKGFTRGRKSAEKDDAREYVEQLAELQVWGLV